MGGPEADELPIFTHWVQFLEWLLPATEKFPKRVRFTFSDRIDNLALDIALDLVEARYTRNKLPILYRINLRLERLRILLRLRLPADQPRRHCGADGGPSRRG